MLNPTAAIIIIGNEILSGRIQDINVLYIAKKLTEIGIKLSEVRIISDTQKMIIDTVLALKSQYDYIFTTGGIGPTHDDITTVAIATALNLSIELNPLAENVIRKFCVLHNQPFNQAVEKMAFLPHGCKLIDNNISGAPGFIVENIYVMAGVPNIMHSMFEQVLSTLKHGNPIISKYIDIMIGENIIATDFADLQNKYPDIEMGSYPFKKDDQCGTSLVLSSANTLLLEQAYADLLKLVHKILSKRDSISCVKSVDCHYELT
ncbi:Competence/damage-inducible protein A [Candidatus Trichorickettsia mobilis]|uniref:Competence/damage-inducible protein A n=1 Tax=Candidatus Trichorickettsia mobilis TaxID=1346319 RepID=A0ABZ0UV98_9RICK|nr:molybdopterin-binding protein [Candidatus Trichorickettsia mobilis]WPY00547.1 Competence/damage-inducible protein A [Candidatus Trichorickettsia mobilis]